MKTLRLFLLGCMLLMAAPLRACLNDFPSMVDYGLRADYIALVHDSLKSRTEIAKFEALGDCEIKASHRNTAAVHHIILGHYTEAYQLLRINLREDPADYKVYANLGTLYELMGKPDSALMYIRKSVEINPQSHNGSEWVHIRILEYKLNRGAASVLRLGKSTKQARELEKNVFEWAPEVKDTLRNILYQLNERIPFTPRPDTLLYKLLSEVDHYMEPYPISLLNLQFRWLATVFQPEGLPGIFPSIEQVLKEMSETADRKAVVSSFNSFKDASEHEAQKRVQNNQTMTVPVYPRSTACDPQAATAPSPAPRPGVSWAFWLAIAAGLGGAMLALRRLRKRAE